MGKLSGLGTESTFTGSDFLVKVKAAGAGDVKVLLSDFLTAIGGFGAWASWTPTVTLNGGTTNGNATITGKYIQIGKTVIFRFYYVIGSTTSFAGLTSFNFTLPVAASSAYTVSEEYIATVKFGHTGNAHYPGLGQLLTSTTINLYALNAAGSFAVNNTMTASIPFGWTSGDTISAWGTYEAA